MKRFLTLALAMALTVALAAPATAADRRPPDQTVTQVSTVRNDTACGSYGVAWNINLTVSIWRFTDDQGRLVRVVQEIVEDNTVVNTVTGLTLRDGPVDFTQVNNFDPATGLLKTIEITGVSVYVVRGDESMARRGGSSAPRGHTRCVSCSTGAPTSLSPSPPSATSSTDVLLDGRSLAGRPSTSDQRSAALLRRATRHGTLVALMVLIGETG